MVNDIPMDTLDLSFTVEEWLDSDTAELTIDIDASVDGSGSVDLRTEIKDSLKELIDIEWRFVQVSRNTDRAGREAWQVRAQARVSEDEITNLGARTKSLGRVGLQYRVGYVDYSPTLEAVEELNRTLRSKINALVSSELKALNTEAAGRKWRLSSINYSNNMSFSNARMAKAPVMMASVQGAGNVTQQSGAYDVDLEVSADNTGGLGGFEISQKVTFTASVTIASTVKGFEEA